MFASLLLALASPLAPPPAPLPPAPLPTPCVALDGDTIRCGRPTRSGRPPERIRLAGIDAPELPGHCRRGRACAPGDPLAARRALAALIAGQRLFIRRWELDGYGRTIATVTLAGGADLSCLQWRAGHAIRVARWDRVDMPSTC